ncbi:hypothetical protein MPSEU_000861500 [Mayamaea pseudoterrestris]|nr:hypothetical protein MPSEU_000861500 [Mayamaea pseudoterrestris]
MACKMRLTRQIALLVMLGLSFIGLSASTKRSSSLSVAPANLLNATTTRVEDKMGDHADDVKRKKKTVAKPSRKVSSKSDTLRRIEREWKDIVASGTAYNWKEGKPIKFQQKQHVWIGPIHSSLLVWHFTMVGLPGSPYANGLYHGRLVLPDNYPASPPRVQVWTASGRFHTRTDICLTASNYHEELWTSNWTIRTIIEALRLHFVTHALEIGGTNEPYEAKLEHAKASRSFFCQIPINRQNIVSIDHAKMIQQGLFADLLEDNEEIELIRGMDTSRNNRKPDMVLSDSSDNVEEAVKHAQAVKVSSSSNFDADALLASNIQPPKKRKRKQAAPAAPAAPVFINTKRPPLQRSDHQTLRVRPAPEPSLLVATVQKILKRPLLWCLLFLFCYLNTRA